MRRPVRAPTPIRDRPPRAIELRSARLAAGLTQRELALLSGTAHETIAKCESGALPATDQRLAHLLGVIEGARR